MKAKFMSLGVKDFFKGLIVAVFSALITFLIEALQTGSEIDLNLLKRAGIASLIAFLSYILKNLFTNSKDQFLTVEK